MDGWMVGSVGGWVQIDLNGWMDVDGWMDRYTLFLSKNCD